METTRQITVLIVEASTLAMILIAAQALRGLFGVTLIAMLVGVMQMPQSQLAATLYLQVSPSVAVSPGSVVLFPFTLCAVLITHVRQGPIPARQLIYAILIANIVAAVIGVFAVTQFESAVAQNILATPVELFAQSSTVIIVGSALLLIDVLLIVSIYESISLRINSWFLRLYLTLVAVLAVDAVLFQTLNFGFQDGLLAALMGTIVAKAAIAVVYALILALFLASTTASRPAVGFRSALSFLTFRADLAALVHDLEHDGLTGVYSRRYLDALIKRHVQDAVRSGRPMALMMIDLDHFKAVNDGFGHAVGDQLLKAMASTIKRVVGSAGSVCRFGGEEFCVVVADTTRSAVSELAEEIRLQLHTAHYGVAKLQGERSFSASIGFAMAPGEAGDPETLYAIADRRLYAAKDAGRDRVVGPDDDRMTRQGEA